MDQLSIAMYEVLIETYTRRVLNDLLWKTVMLQKRA